MANPRDKEFVEGVIFTFPDDLSNVEVERIEPITKPDATIKFSPNRYIIEVKLYDKNDPEKKEMKHFGDGFKMRVYFLQSDLDSAGGIDNLKLAYHDGTDWTVFEEDGKHKFKKKLKEQGPWIGYCTLKVKTWVDPVMSLGP
ncbi:MAG: hypothetical protein GTO18_14950 [Anaerolineales bacterium]|nr:hypothetical protein [Anaerolineales bacterium]